MAQTTTARLFEGLVVLMKLHLPRIRQRRDTSMHRRSGFTLIEIVIVAAVILLLLAFLLPVFRAAREKGRQTQCASNLAQIGKALHLYAQDYGGYIPPYNTVAGVGPLSQHSRMLQRVMEPYLRSTDVWFCPSDHFREDPEAAHSGDTSFDHVWGSYATHPFIPPMVIEPGHRLVVTPWKVDSPGSNGEQQPSDTLYAADWFMFDPYVNAGHNGFGNGLMFDGRVIAKPAPRPQ